MNSAQDESLLRDTPVKKLFWKYTLPAITAMIVNGMYTVVDGFFIGHYIGAEGLAGINILWPLFGMAIGIGTMIGTAASSLFSIEKGKGDYEKARRYLANGFILVALLSLAVTALFYYCARFFMELQVDNSPETVAHAMDYFNVVTFLAFFVLASNAMPQFVRNDDRPKLATVLMIAGALLNVVGDYVFIKHFHRGMAGAAEATILSQIIVSIIGFAYFFSPKARLRLRVWDLKFSYKICRDILVLGVSSLMIFFYYGFISAIYNFLFAKHGGAVCVAAYSAVNYVSYLYYMFAEGFTAGVQPIMSFNFGAVRYYNIRRTFWHTVRVLFILYVGFMVVVYGFPERLAMLFTNGDASFEAETVRGLRLFLCTCFLEAFILLGIVYFQSTNKAKTASLVSGINMTVQLPFLLALPHYFGINGIWLCYPLANVPLSLVVFVLVVRDLRRITHDLIKKRNENRKAQSAAS